MSKLAWVDAAVREEAERQGYTTPAFLNCSAWQTLAQKKPILDRECDTDQALSLARVWRGKEGSEMPPQEWSDQEIALRVVVREAVIAAADCTPTLTERELDDEIGKFQADSVQLQFIAKRIKSLEDGDVFAEVLEKSCSLFGA